jgi:hypothetical protein
VLIYYSGYFQNQEAVMKFSKDNVSDYEITPFFPPALRNQP